MPVEQKQKQASGDHHQRRGSNSETSRKTVDRSEHKERSQQENATDLKGKKLSHSILCACRVQFSLRTGLKV